MSEITLVEAVTQALAHELEADERVLLLGEDIGTNGGVFRATAGLQKGDSLQTKVRAVLAELEQRKGYEVQLRAAVEACR